MRKVPLILHLWHVVFGGLEHFEKLRIVETELRCEHDRREHFALPVVVHHRVVVGPAGKGGFVFGRRGIEIASAFHNPASFTHLRHHVKRHT